MKNRTIKNMIRTMKDNMAQNRGYIRSKRARIMTLTLCAALVLGQAGTEMAVLAAGSGKSTAEEEVSGEEILSDQEETVNLLLAADTGGSKGTENAEDAAGISKEETVYILTDASGSAQKIIVSDWIKNSLGKNKINDVTELKELESVKDELDYTTGKSNEKIWNANGGDIYYQGNIEKDLPVTMKVTYLLDGKEISSRELAGKSGKVTIRFDYTNTQYEEVEIDGEKTKIYVPFAMMTGMILDNEVFTNVEVTNGRLMNDGDRTVVTGLAFPGLQESLNADSEKMEIPDYVEVTADVKEFKLGMTATVASNEVFSGINLEKKDTLENLSGSMGELTNAMDQLMDGSSQLYEGLCTLLDKSGELVKGIDQLAAGSAELQKGAGSLNEGASKLQDGAARLQNGLNTLTSKNAELNGGARQVFETLLSTARTQLTAAGLNVPEMTIENYGEALNQVIASLDGDAVYQQALEQVTSAVEEKRPYIESQVTDAVRGEVAAKVEAAVREQVTAKVREAAVEQVTGAVTEAVREQVTAEVTKAAGEQVTQAVTAEVKKQVTGQVIRNVTGMEPEAYEEAVAAGTIDEGTQSAVRTAIEDQMETDGVKAEIQANVNAQLETIVPAKVEEQMAADGVKAEIQANVDAQLQTIVPAKVEEQMAAEEIQATIQSNIDAQMQSVALKETIAANTELQVQKAITENMAGEEVQNKLAAASEGAKSVISLKASLDNYNVFYLGLQAYTAGVAEAASGAGTLTAGINELKGGTGKLQDGSSQLYNGIQTMKDNTPALVGGIAQLRDGARELSDGLGQFNEEGISRLVEAVDGDLEGLTDRIYAISDVSKNYKTFAGITNEMEGSVKFIYRTEAVEAGDGK